MDEDSHDIDRPSPPRAVSFVTKAVRGLRAPVRAALSLVLFGGLLWGGYQALYHPHTPLRDAWNPAKPLRIADPVTPLTRWKMSRALSDPALCRSVLDAAAVSAPPLADLEKTPVCHIRGRVKLSGVGAAKLAPVETRCSIALRLAMWERHALQPAAQAHLGTDLIRIRHYASYNCRAIRTPQGGATRMSTHATADAIDVSGFDFKSGKRLSLKHDWNGAAPDAAFLRAAQAGACRWFNTVLGPEYNALHADHFHMQNTGWNSCH